MYALTMVTSECVCTVHCPLFRELESLLAALFVEGFVSWMDHSKRVNVETHRLIQTMARTPPRSCE